MKKFLYLIERNDCNDIGNDVISFIANAANEKEARTLTPINYENHYVEEGIKPITKKIHELTEPTQWTTDVDAVNTTYIGRVSSEYEHDNFLFLVKDDIH